MILSPIVIKVGGSLYDWSDLRPRLRQWLDHLGPERVLLVPGGGPIVDVVRGLDRQHRLGEEAAHWLALRTLSVNGQFLASLVARAVVVETLEECSRVWERNGLAILDPHAFYHARGERETSLPCSWDVTSDSIAADVAQRLAARRLILLKSTDAPAGGDWIAAGRRGVVDPWFAQVVGPDLTVEVVNLRRWSE